MTNNIIDDPDGKTLSTPDAIEALYQAIVGLFDLPLHSTEGTEHETVERESENSVVFTTGALAGRFPHRSRTWLSTVLRDIANGTIQHRGGMAVELVSPGVYRLIRHPHRDPATGKPVHQDPELAWQIDGHELDAASWSLGYGAQLTYALGDNGTVDVSLSLSDYTAATGYLNRTATRQQILDHAMHLIRLAGGELTVVLPASGEQR